jgi:hypothetical protein
MFQGTLFREKNGTDYGNVQNVLRGLPKKKLWAIIKMFTPGIVKKILWTSVTIHFVVINLVEWFWKE